MAGVSRPSKAIWKAFSQECFQEARNTAGLDEYQVGDWRAWYAHITLSMSAHAWLVVARTLTAKGEPESAAA